MPSVLREDRSARAPEVTRIELVVGALALLAGPPQGEVAAA
jgi:hypothetical protein